MIHSKDEKQHIQEEKEYITNEKDSLESRLLTVEGDINDLRYSVICLLFGHIPFIRNSFSVYENYFHLSLNYIDFIFCRFRFKRVQSDYADLQENRDRLELENHMFVTKVEVILKLLQVCKYMYSSA